MKNEVYLISLCSEGPGKMISDRPPIRFAFHDGVYWFRRVFSVDELFSILVSHCEKSRE